MRHHVLLGALMLAASLAAPAARAQNAIETQIQNQNRQLDQMIQNQGQLRQQQFDNSSIRMQLDRDRNRPPNYPTTDPQPR